MAFQKRIQVAGGPRMKQAGQGQTGLGAFRTAGTTTDLAHDHQGPNAAFRQVVVGRQPLDQDKLEQLL